MARFNFLRKGKTKTTNLAGGVAYQETPELELVSILLTSFAKDQFYRSANDTFDRVKALSTTCDPAFAAKAAVYARTEFGMRSITHVLAGHLAKRASGTNWGKSFYDKVVKRPDDMLEILSYYTSLHNKRPTNAMKKGFAAAFNRFDTYQLAKYRGENRDFKLVDAVNLIHPRSTDKNHKGLKQLVEGTLRNTNTWEAKLSASKGDKKQKQAAWQELLKSNKLGYFALLRNLSNILEQAPDMVDIACKQLTNERRIKKSLVLPFRYLTALEMIEKLNFQGTRKVMVALNKALDISCSNVPRFEGKTLIVLDVSGSMTSQVKGTTPAKIGSVFAAILSKANLESDFMVFDNTARYEQLNPLDSTTTIAKSIPFTGGGTNFHSIFEKANKGYDRIIILSDMQGWMNNAYGSNNVPKSYNEYCKKTRTQPHLYSFDLAGHGSLQFPQNKVYCIAGFSDKVFDLMKVLEQDRNALVNKIKAVAL